MQIELIGTGCGRGTLTAEAKEALAEANLVIGAGRVLDMVREYLTEGTETIPEISAAGILEHILTRSESVISYIAVVYSGDSGFYSGAAGLIRLLQERGLSFRVLPGISSVQVLSARLQKPWQEWHLASGHGRELDVIGEMMHGRDTFFLTDGRINPVFICAELNHAGLGGRQVWIGYDLGTEDEQLINGTARQIAASLPQNCGSHQLAVVLVEKILTPGTTASVLDHEMIRGPVPMTKQDVRAAIVNRLRVGVYDTVWDIGAGTGSVSVALSLAARYGRTYAIESKPEAVSLIEENRRRFGAWNLRVILGTAPEACRELPAPNVVFVGGSSGNLTAILAEALEINPKVRLLVSAVLVETLQEAVSFFAGRGIGCMVTQIASAGTVDVAGRHMMKAETPVWLIERTSQDDRQKD